MTCCYTQGWNRHSTLIFEDSSCSWWNQYRDPQLSNVHRVRDFGACNLKWVVFIQLVVDDSKETTSSRHNWTDTHMDSRRLGQHAEDLLKSKPHKTSAWRKESGCKVSPWTKTPSIAAGKGKPIFSIEQHWVYRPHSRADPMFKSSCPTQGRLHGVCACVHERTWVFCFIYLLFYLFYLFLLIWERTCNCMPRELGRNWRSLGTGKSIRIWSPYTILRKSI